MSLASLRQQLNVSGEKINDRDKELMDKWIKDGFDHSNDNKADCVEIFSDQMTCFLFEAIIRPHDKGLVIHLKYLPPALRNPKFFDFATTYIRDRVGKFKSLDASFIGELDSANRLNSLDLMFTDYYPAKVGDMAFIKQHTSKIGKELDDILVRELGEYAASKNKK